MRRWLIPAALVLLVALGVWGGYWGYARLQALEARLVALENRLSTQEEALKALGERVGKLEGEVFQAPAPPLALPETPAPSQPPAWPYAVGVVVVLLLLYLLLRLVQRPGERSVREGATPSGLEEARMEDEGAPPRG